MQAPRAVDMLLVVLAAGAVGCMQKGGVADTSRSAATVTQAGDPAVRSAIQAADSQFFAAFKAGDAKGAAAVYEQDAVSMPPNEEPESGRDAIEKGFGGLFQQTGKILDVSGVTRDLDIYGDHAVEVGSYSMSFQPAGAKEPVKDHGSYINYWRKQADGSWRIHRDAVVSAMPMPMPGAPAPANAKK